jgi:isoamylase
MATLLLAQGTPMLLAGDELGRTQRGNNNAYCQDNEISWHDWDAGAGGHALAEWVRRMVALRGQFPVLRRGRFLTGALNEEIGAKDVTWINIRGAEMTHQDWHDDNNRCFGMLLDGRAQATGVRRPASDATLLWVLNAHPGTLRFTLPEVSRGERWTTLFDSFSPAETGERTFRGGDACEVAGQSTQLFALKAPYLT